MKGPIARAMMFCRDAFGRGLSSKPSRTVGKRRRFALEPLESRMLLSVDLIGIPDWVDQGPGPENSGGAIAAPNNAVNGATEVLLTHPSIANMAFAGTVAGGVWRTADITGGGNAANIVWEPLTDQLTSLYVGAMAFDPSSANTLYVGTGSYSNTFRNQLSEMAVGLFRTTNASAPAADVAWENLGGAVFANQPIRRIAVSPGDPQLIFVAADDGGGNGGIFRSVTGTNGQQWTELSNTGGLAIAGGVSDVIRDPNRANTYYIAAPNVGVFRTDNNGTNWTRIDNLNTAVTGIGGSVDIEIVLHDAGATTVVYVGVVGSAGSLTGVFRYAEDGLDNNGTGGVDDATESSWTVIGAAPAIHVGQQGFNNFSFAADPVNANLVYVGGDRPPDLFRGDAGANTWTDLAVNGTRPHADSRWIGFLNNTTMVETDDGGIFRLTNPAAPGGADVWVSLNANLRAIEFHSVAYDTAANLIFGGSQDNGSAVQTGVGSLTWNMFQGGDGSTQSYSIPGNIRYSLGNNFGSFTRGGTQLQLRAQPGGVANFDGLENTSGGTTDRTFATNPGFESRLPVEANRFNANDLLLARRALYESTNQGDNITTVITPTQFGKGATERFNSIVYGGVRAGTNFANVFWAGTEAGRLFVRDESGTITDRTAALTAVIPGTAALHDIAIDPDDYRRAFVLKGDRVAVTTNSGANWTEITDNIGQLTTELRSIALVDATPGTALDGTLVVGGLGGVFRWLPAISPAGTTWSEFGIMPNSLVQDMDFVAVDPDGNAADGIGILLAGTFGRGAQTISDVTAFIDVPGVLQIFGDTDFFGEDDTIRLIRRASMPNLLDVFLNSTTPVLTVELSALHQINVFGLAGNDTLIVDSTNGLINVPLGIRYDGGAGADQLQLLQTGGPTHVTDTYSVGPAIGSGISMIVGTGAAGTQTVFFENLSPVLDLVPVALLTVNATAAGNAISYTGSGANGVVAIDSHEPIAFANKTSLVINAGAGSDTISVNSAITPAGLTGITLNGGDPGSGDTLIVTGVGVAVAVNTATGTITGATGVGGAIPITYATVESLNLAAGIGDLTITTTGADDAVVVTPGLAAGANSGSVESSGAVPLISFVNSGTFTANLGAGNDSLTVNGSSNPDTAAVSGTAVNITGRRAVSVTGAESIRVNGQGGNDTFNVTPSALVGIFIDGGDPVGSLPGDLLNIIAGVQSVTFNAGPETDEGSFVVGANEPVSFDHIESFSITGTGPAVINGTNGPDTITVIARDASTHAAANGVQDFTVSVNTGPELLFINVALLTINALSGSDQITLSTPAPNNAVWDVDVTVNGGAPAADTDRLIVQTPSAAPDTVVFVPTAADGGLLDFTILSSLITINTTEVLSYDGLGDNDILSVLGTSGDDVFVHLPGSNDQAGSLQVNSLLTLGYQGMGAAGSVTARGADGNDTLVAYGTAANDSFTVDTVGITGQINLNSRVVLNTTTMETLTLEGLAGDDTFTLVPAISASVYTTMNFNGGAQASAVGDRVFLIATAGADAIVVSGQTVSLGGKTVQSSGVESIRLDALGGDDLLTYNGVAGVTEDINVSSSGIAGGGQLSAPGVTLVDFSGVERVDVHGNTPTPTETDTLTFTGTNAQDTVQINLAADGTDGDPILRLEDTLAATLLTLRNYTNFATLNVIGLDGENTFNVRTDATGPSRDLFVDGGVPAGKKKQTDNLNIFYVPPRPHIIHSAATQDPDAGLVSLDYDTALFLIQYDGIEQVVIRRE